MIIDELVNYETINLLEKYSNDKKPITIRTWGKVEEQQERLKKLGILELLEKKGIEFKFASKYDFAWATVEICIDDFDTNMLILEYAIKAKSLIHPNEKTNLEIKASTIQSMIADSLNTSFDTK